MTKNSSDQFRGKYNLGITDFIKGISFPEDFLLLSTEALSKYPGQGVFSESWLFEYLNNISERFIDAIENDRIDWMTGHLRSFTDQKVDSFLEANAKKPLKDLDRFKDECFLYIIYRIKTEVERNKKRDINSFSPRNDVKFYTDRYHLLFRDFLNQTPVGAKDYISYLDNVSVALASSLDGKDKLKEFTDHLDLLASIIVKTASEYSNDVLTIKLKQTMSELIDSYLNAKNINPKSLPEKFYDNCFLIVIYRIQLWEKEGKISLLSKAGKEPDKNIENIQPAKPVAEPKRLTNLENENKPVYTPPLFDKETYNMGVNEFIQDVPFFDKKYVEDEISLIISSSKKSNISDTKLISYLNALSDALNKEIDKNGKEWKIIHIRRLIEHKIGVFLKDTPLTETREGRKLYDACFVFVLDKLKKYAQEKESGDKVINSGDQPYGYYIDDLSEVTQTEIDQLENEIIANERVYNKNFNSIHYMAFVKSLLPILQQAVDNSSYKVSDIVKHIDDSIEFYRKQGKNQCSGFSTMIFRYLSMLIKQDKQQAKKGGIFLDKSTAQDKKKIIVDNIPDIPVITPESTVERQADDFFEIRSNIIQPGGNSSAEEEYDDNGWIDDHIVDKEEENKKKERKISILLYAAIFILFLALIITIINLMPEKNPQDNPNPDTEYRETDHRFENLDSSGEKNPDNQNTQPVDSDNTQSTEGTSTGPGTADIENAKSIEQAIKMAEEAKKIAEANAVSGSNTANNDPGAENIKPTDTHRSVDVANVQMPDGAQQKDNTRPNTGNRGNRRNNSTNRDQEETGDYNYIYPSDDNQLIPGYDNIQPEYNVHIVGRPATGSVVYKNPKFIGVYDNSTKGYINITNNTSKDAVAILYYVTGRKVMRNIYIRTGESITVRGIPEGLYRIKCLFGNEWNPNLNNGAGNPVGGFISNVSFLDMDNNEKFGMHEDTSYEGSTSYSTFNVKLGGDILTNPITSEEFFKN